MIEQFDVIVIGAGQAGPALAARCGREGLKTALIERDQMGGTCVNNGCIPTKSLIASARVAALARRAAEYGVILEQPPRVDMPAVKARKDRIVQASRTGVTHWMEGARNVNLIRGHAYFTGPHEISIADRASTQRILTAGKIFINAGGRPSTPALAGIEGVHYLTNVSMMDLDTVPEHLIIIGGSYIGLEFAQMYRRFGARVTICEKGPRLIAREDEDISDEVRAILEREGIVVRTGANCLSVERHAAGIAVGVDCDSGAPKIEGSHLLLAIGRTPNTEGLGLDQAGVAIDKRGFITVNDQLETNVSGIYALGDINGRGAFTHTSWNDYEIVAANLFDGGSRRVSDRIPTYALFIDPPLGRVGLSVNEARATGRAILTSKMLMSRVGRAQEAGETQGFMKIVVDAQSQRILGAAILGMSGDEVVQSILEVMVADQPYTSINRGVHIHPTVCELLPTLLENLKA
jgi:pyruvate/2-oxoglutarate dehydrogenase complex dihydrolipoamide dehydrogenase (E3) component